MGVRREKAALSSGCKPHPATAPAGSNRSSHEGNEMDEAFGAAGHDLVTAQVCGPRQFLGRRFQSPHDAIDLRMPRVGDDQDFHEGIL
jgi:hypothetical protein